jgi:hypothetical protein
MKTSIIISSIAALCLLLTFAEAPRRHVDDKMIAASTENITFTTVNSVTMLSGPVITPARKNNSVIPIPPAPAEDFSYLKFNVNDYMEADAANPEVIEILPEAIETDFSYLKFNVSNYMSDDGLNSGEITELPENEISSRNPYENVPVAIQFDYLRFDVNKYISESGTKGGGIGELPAEESLPNEEAITTVDFSYLKFDVTKYYIPEKLGSGDQFELPEK